jgi:membrane fusion protein (multidrug efflux system)
MLQKIGPSFFLFCIALFFVACTEVKKETKKEDKKETKNQNNDFNLTRNQIEELYFLGEVIPYEELTVAFEVSGKLEKGDVDLLIGKNFKKKDLICKVNFEEAFYNLGYKKAHLCYLIIEALPEINSKFPAEKEKWETFLNAISPSNLLPEFPIFGSEEEKSFIQSKDIFGDYLATRSLEVGMKKYIFLAPFNGTITEVSKGIGSTVIPGQSIAKIARTDKKEIRAEIPVTEISSFKSAKEISIIDESGNELGLGKIERISEKSNVDNQKTTVYFSIKLSKGKQIFSGQQVKLSKSDAHF